MGDEFDYDFDNDVTLAPDEKNIGGTKSDWLKMTVKGQKLRVAFVYFHTYDHNAVGTAIKEARKSGKTLSREEIQQVGKKALADRAQELSKAVDALTPVDKLDVRTAHFKSFKAHYQEGLGYAVTRLGKDGPEADAVWRKLPEAKPYFTTLLLIYPTDEQGNLIKEIFIEQVKAGTLKFMPWRFGNQVYEEIWNVNDGLRENTISLSSQDIRLECKEPKFHKISVSFAGAATWLKNDSIKSVVLTKALEMYGENGSKLLPFKEMSTDQLKAKLGMGGAVTTDVSSDNFQSILDQV
jgi:hypothetical protein